MQPYGLVQGPVLVSRLLNRVFFHFLGQDVLGLKRSMEALHDHMPEAVFAEARGVAANALRCAGKKKDIKHNSETFILAPSKALRTRRPC